MPKDRRDDDDSVDEGTPHRNHYWSLRDILELKEKVNSHFHTIWTLKIT